MEGRHEGVRWRSKGEEELRKGYEGGRKGNATGLRCYGRQPRVGMMQEIRAAKEKEKGDEGVWGKT